MASKEEIKQELKKLAKEDSKNDDSQAFLDDFTAWLDINSDWVTDELEKEGKIKAERS
jgi:hypothetical protein